MIILLVFVLDRFLKLLAFFYEPNFKIFIDFFRFSFAVNYGLAFSINFPTEILLFLYLLGFFGLGVILLKTFTRIRYCASILFILCGAFSNFLDRLFLGYVIDYFAVFNLNVFNLADLMILIGAGMFLKNIFKGKDLKS